MTALEKIVSDFKINSSLEGKELILDITKIYNFAVFDKSNKLNKNQEKAISKNGYYSLLYARNIIKGRFELGEKNISRCAEHSYLYAYHALRGRFQKGERIISKSAHWSFYYALNVIKGRFELGEKPISRDEEYSQMYAECVLKLT
jgi:hypothetical protein